VINTSFNVRGEPIVCTPEDAWNCFLGTEMDVLVAGRFLLRKGDQDPDLVEKVRSSRRFEAD
jgi:carbamoyltransferase